MNNQTSVEALQKLIKISGHLSLRERDEWLGLLPYMNDRQKYELLAILQPELVATKSSVPSFELELPAGPVELDLPAPSQNSLKQSADVNNTPIEALPLGTPISAFINRNFGSSKLNTSTSTNSISEKLVAKNEDITKPKTKIVPERPIVPSNSVSMAVPKAPVRPEVPVTSTSISLDFLPEASTEEVLSNIKNLEDTRKINVATFRSLGAEGVQEVLNKLCEKFGYFSLQFALEHSPLYQTYLIVGSKSLKGAQTFDQTKAELDSKGKSYLTKEEFEQVSDILQKLKNS